MYRYNEDKDNASEKNISNIGNSLVSGGEAVRRADDIQFYKWMNNNYDKSGIFSSQESIRNYINESPGHELALTKSIQGKGYEYNFIVDSRKKPENILKRYDAGDVLNRPGSDVSEISLLTGKTKEYQMKAYTSNNVPDLHNTPNDMTIVVNAEKADAVAKKGYTDVQVYKTSEQISRNTKKRLDEIKNGKIYTQHTMASTLKSAGKSGVSGIVSGAVEEAVNLRNAYKKGEITREEYVKEIAKSGAQSGINAAITTATTMKLAEAAAIAGTSSLPVMAAAAGISKAVDKMIAPVFKKGVYKDAKEAISHIQESVMEPLGQLTETTIDTAMHSFDFIDQLSDNIELSERNTADRERILNESTELRRRLNGED